MNALAIAFEEFPVTSNSASPLAHRITFSAAAPAVSPVESEVIDRNIEIMQGLGPAIVGAQCDNFRVSVAALQNFPRMLALLPENFPVTDPYVSHTGSICLDWDEDPNNQFSVMLLDGDRIAYSAYLGGERVNGSAAFTGDQLPVSLILAAGQWSRRAGRR